MAGGTAHARGTGSMILDYTVTWLEMTARPTLPRREKPDHGLSLIRAQNPPVHFFRYLYDAVGAAYEWTDLHTWHDAQIAAFAQDDAVHLNVAYRNGCPVGFIMLDFRDAPVADVAYFGLMPEAVGSGLGSWLLLEGIHDAWAAKIEKLTVNTCTLDHPSALPLYQKMGFEPVRRQTLQRAASSVSSGGA